MSTSRFLGRLARIGRTPGDAPRRIAVLLLAVAAVMSAGSMAASALTTVPLPAAQPGHDRDTRSAGLGRSVPVRLVIPALGVDAEVVTLRLHRGELGLPADPRLAGWYERGTSPGELGSAVIVGRAGPVRPDRPIFAELGRLAAGDTVRVVRADGMVASFAVERVESAVGGCTAAERTACGEACGPDAGGRCGIRDAWRDTGEAAQLRLVSARGTDPPADHEFVVFATLRP